MTDLSFEKLILKQIGPFNALARELIIWRALDNSLPIGRLVGWEEHSFQDRINKVIPLFDIHVGIGHIVDNFPE
jgi:hypothetical protein